MGPCFSDPVGVKRSCFPTRVDGFPSPALGDGWVYVLPLFASLSVSISFAFVVVVFFFRSLTCQDTYLHSWNRAATK